GRSWCPVEKDWGLGLRLRLDHRRRRNGQRHGHGQGPQDRTTGRKTSQRSGAAQLDQLVPFKGFGQAREQQGRLPDWNPTQFSLQRSFQQSPDLIRVAPAKSNLNLGKEVLRL